MSIYTISDLHLSFGTNKPMYIFGDNWINHEKKIKQNWIEYVKKDDLVILPGDFSWAMRLKDTIYDFAFLEELPGKKILLKGNHDYWWTTLAKMRQYLKENNFTSIDFIYNNSYFFDEQIIVGTRGWSTIENENTEKMLNRETIRLELSIRDGIEKYGTNYSIIACMHYPPQEEFKKIIEKYKNIKIVIYGHLHGICRKDAIEEKINDVEYKLVSCDCTDFKLIKIR